MTSSISEVSGPPPSQHQQVADRSAPPSHVTSTRVPRGAAEEEGKNEEAEARRNTTATTRRQVQESTLSSGGSEQDSTRRRRVSFSENITKSAAANGGEVNNAKKLIKTRSFSSNCGSKPPILAPKPFFVAAGRAVKAVTSVVEKPPKFCSKSSCRQAVGERKFSADDESAKSANSAAKNLSLKREEKTAATMPHEVAVAERQVSASKCSDVTVVNEVDDGEPAAFTSVSARRGKFEQMNGNHAISPPCDVTEVNSSLANPLLANAAKTLFKDILQMKDLNGLERTKQQKGGGGAANPLLKQQTTDDNDDDDDSAPMRNVMINAMVKRGSDANIKPSSQSSRDQQRRHKHEEEDDWFKNIPLPPLALQPSPPPLPPNLSSAPPIYYPTHSSVTSEQRIAESQPTVTDQSKQSGNDEEPAPPIPPKGAGGSVAPHHQRSLEEEILYYDNMDIMEKVRQEQKGERETTEEEESKAKKEKPTTTTAAAAAAVAVKDEKVQVISQQQQEEVNEDKQQQNKSDYELHQAIGKLEEQFNKLTKQMATFQDVGGPPASPVQPPKLPPKQHRFNRQQTINKQQVLLQQQQASPPPSQTLNERFKIHQQLLQQQQRKKEEIANLQRQQQKRECEERERRQQQQTETTPQQQTPVTSPRQATNGAFFSSNGFVQCSPEDVRARALVDEPLAPIIEEDSVCEDSSCTSSVTGDDISTQADSYSCANGTASLSAGSSTWSPASSRRVLTDDDGGATETETTADEKTTPSDGELSDADSVRWQSNPLSPTATTKVKKKISFSTTSSDDVSTIRRRSTKDRSESVTTSSRRPSQDSVHSWKDSDCTIDDNESAFSDVAPYGMVDLTKFEPTYHAEKKQPIPVEVLTPHSILTSVQDFNSTLSRHRGTNNQSRSAPDESELPSFPLQINNSPTTTTNGTNPWSKTLKRKKPQEKPPNQDRDDGIGYDNLENYGGEDRRAAKQQQQVGSAVQSVQQQQQQKAKPIETPPGAEKPTPKPRDLPNVTASRLARHSSAVTALDRHSNNLKRNIKPPVIKQQKQTDTKQQGDIKATQDRRRKISRSSTSSEASTTCTDLEGRGKTNTVRITRQSSTTSSLSDTTHSGSRGSLQLRANDDNSWAVNPYEEVSLVKTAAPKPEVESEDQTAAHKVNNENSESKEELENFSKSPSSQSLVEVTDTTSTNHHSTLFNGEDSTEDPPQPAPRSLGSQLRNFLSGNPENKYISPSLRRKRSLLKRSKSPGGSRRSRTPPRSKSSVSDSGKEAEDDTISTGSQRKEKRSEKQRNKVKEEEDPRKEEEEEAPKEIVRKERSASQRLVDRRGRSKKSSFRRSEGDLEKKGENEEKKKKMGSRWRRSKSQDRVSPSRSKSKERKLGRSKSTERPMPKEVEHNDPNNTEREDRGRSRSIFKRSRSSSRKRDGRGKSSERKEEGGRGRNPVSFFRKLLKKRESDNEEEPEEESIVQVPLGETRSRSGSSEALSTILAYKNSDTKAEKGSWTPPRPSSSVQRAINNNSPRNTDSKHKNKKSPSKHSKGNSNGPSTESFSTSRRAIQSNQQSLRRPPSLTNSTPSSDSENNHRTESLAHPTFMQKRSLRRKLLLAREYDSDTSALASSDNSLRPGLAIKSSLRKPNRSDRNLPRRPVRVVSPRRSQSEPTLVDASDHTYYNVEGNEQREVFRYPSTTQNGGHPADLEEKNSITSRVGGVDKQLTSTTTTTTVPLDVAYAAHQRKKYQTIVSLNAQTLKKITERRLAEWRNQLPVGGFLITSWSDVALTSHRPLCMIGNSVVYGAVSNGNNKFNLACQLYEYRKMDNKLLQKIESCTSLTSHPNVCGVCSYFVCRVPRSLLDPSSGGGAADAICIVLSNRPKETIEDNLERVLNQGDSTEYHRQILLTILQLIQGVKHLFTAGFQLPPINADQIISTDDHGFAQILPHLAFCDATTTTSATSNNKKQKSNKQATVENNAETVAEINNKNTSAHTQQLAQLIKRLLQKGAGSRPGDRNSTSSTSGSRVVVPGTKYSSAIKHTIHFLQRSITSGENLQRAAQVIQCALWGPEDLDDVVGVTDDVTPLMALELWVEMEQAKLVNSLAVVLSSSDRLTPVAMMKHRFFAGATPQMLLDGLKILQRI